MNFSKYLLSMKNVKLTASAIENKSVLFIF